MTVTRFFLCALNVNVICRGILLPRVIVFRIILCRYLPECFIIAAAVHHFHFTKGTPVLEVNDRIGPYQLSKELGAGAFGEVWLAENVEARVTPHRKVALKIPHKGDREEVKKQVEKEAEIWLLASETNHPNVVPFIEATVFGKYFVIVSKYMPDGSLEQWLKQHGGRAPSIEEALDLTRGILNGLAHLHQPRMIGGEMQHIIHRDLKPGNVLLQGPTPRITDFGISRLFETTSQSAVIAGTGAYMAPEAFDGKRNQQTDVWSVGVMLYQMLAGRLPFTGKTNLDRERAVRSQEPHPLPASIPGWLQKIVFKALAKKPAERYQTATEMLSALQPPAPTPPVASPKPQHSRRKHSRRSWLGTIAVNMKVFHAFIAAQHSRRVWLGAIGMVLLFLSIWAGLGKLQDDPVKVDPTPAPTVVKPPAPTPKPKPIATATVTVPAKPASTPTAIPKPTPKPPPKPAPTPLPTPPVVRPSKRRPEQAVVKAAVMPKKPKPKPTPRPKKQDPDCIFTGRCK